MSRERNDEHDEIREQQQKTDVGTGHGVRGQGGQEESLGVPVDGDGNADEPAGNG